MSQRILVADDSGVMRKIIIRALNSVGATDIVQAADGQEAIDHFNSASFDLVLTDWNMPHKTGIEVLEEIRQKDKAIPVILITTESEKARVLQAIQAGVSDYLTKPFDSDALKEKLDKYVSA